MNKQYLALNFYDSLCAHFADALYSCKRIHRLLNILMTSFAIIPEPHLVFTENGFGEHQLVF